MNENKFYQQNDVKAWNLSANVILETLGQDTDGKIIRI